MSADARRIPEWWLPAAGAAFWGIAVAIEGIDDLRGFAWSAALLSFAALVVVPLVLGLAESGGRAPGASRLLRFAQLLQFPAAILLTISVAMDSGYLSLALAGPWIAVTVIASLAGVGQIATSKSRNVADWCGSGGLVFFSVGGAWVAADRLGVSPLGFGSDIVQLTAVHFHYAGLALPVLTGCVLREFPASRLGLPAGFGVLAGVPLVAVGITGAQLGTGQLGEVVAAIVLGSAGILVAVFQARLAMQSHWPQASRLLWAVASLSLAFGMVLAVLYGIRSLTLPFPWLGIPWMRALHGTSNAIGFCLCGAIGWRLVIARRSSAAAK